MTTSPHPPGPVTVGPYRLLTRLGEGGMGVVHLGQTPDGSRHAVKVLRPYVVGDEEARRRLAREVDSLSRVRSPRVAEILDADPWGPVPYVATRYVPGLSLHDHVREQGPVTGDDLAWLARGLAEALTAVHGVGVLHRDIKPSNVLMEGRSPVLIDFGLARVADDSRLTRTGWLLGTPGYLAPEILLGADPSAASDVHSWAATVAFAGTGRAPYGTGPSVAVMDRVRRGEHDLAGLDPTVRDLVARALDPDPARRPGLPAVLTVLGGAVAPAGPDVDAGPPTMPFVASPDHQPTEQQAPEDATRDLGDTGTQTTPGAREPYRTPPPAQWPPRTPVAERMRRWVLGGAALAVLAAALGAAPYLTLLLVAVTVLVVRGLSLTASEAAGRRLRRGRAWYDVPLAAASAPWLLVVSVPGSLLLLLWTAGLLACVALVLALTDLDVLPSLWLLGAALGVVLWTGPGASRLRSPARRVAVPLAREAGPVLAALVVLLALGTALAWSGIENGTAWAPDRPPWERFGFLTSLR